MPIDQLIAGLFRAQLLLAIVLAFATAVTAIFQVFVTVVFIRFVFFAWRWLGVHEMALHEESLKLKGEWSEELRPRLAGLEVAMTTRWRSVLWLAYLFLPGIAVVAGFFALNQPAAWLLLTVLGVLFILLLIVILVNH